jgi:hypothetical protein
MVLYPFGNYSANPCEGSESHLQWNAVSLNQATFAGESALNLRKGEQLPPLIGNPLQDISMKNG